MKNCFWDLLTFSFLNFRTKAVVMSQKHSCIGLKHSPQKGIFQLDIGEFIFECLSCLKIPRPELLLVIIIVISPKSYLIYGHHFNFVPDWPRVICAYSQWGDITFKGAILNLNHPSFWANFSPIFYWLKVRSFQK